MERGWWRTVLWVTLGRSLAVAGAAPQLGQVPLLSPASSSSVSNSSFLPLLPPAVPLAVRSPYVSAWLASSESPNDPSAGYLARRWPQFWPIQYPNASDYRLSWSGIIRVNGTPYVFMGRPADAFPSASAHLPEAVQRLMSYSACNTTFEFQAGSVAFSVSFLSPPGPPGDLVRQSLPFSYLSVSLLHPLSPSQHVEVYTDIQADWASLDPAAPVTWVLDQSDSVYAYSVEKQHPIPLAEQFEYPQWGQAIYAALKLPGLTTASGPATQLRESFMRDGMLDGQQDSRFRPINDRAPTFAYASALSDTTGPLLFAIGHVRDPYVAYIRADVKGLQSRYGYWRTQFPQAIQAVEFFLKDFQQAVQAAAQLDDTVANDARRMGGEDYVAIASLSTRQALGAIEITVGKDSQQHFNLSDTLAFLKEISSNGDMSTVDVIFPQFPILAYFDPALLRLILEPLFEYSESGLYPNLWTVHDLGTYPNATGHNDGQDESMPVEEAGNMLIMALAYFQLTKDTAWLSRHYRILSQWTSFLVNDGLIPAHQLSTDDFAGKLANQTNLAVKAIVGIGAMSEIAKATGFRQDQERFRSTAEKYVQSWQEFALAKDQSHTKLAYQDGDNSWGTLYNLFADRLLNTKLFPQSVYEHQTSFYSTVVNEYGLPLDHRHTWAKTDWEMFVAGTATTVAGRDLLISRLVKYLAAHRVNAAFPDLYETQTGQFPGRSQSSTWKIEFINRPVAGGHFSVLALDKLNKINGVHDYPFREAL